MKRPGYREAVAWVANNDDCYWTQDSEPIISVTAAMVADLFDVPEAKVIADVGHKWRETFNPNPKQES
jgi:hypothetical protein